MNGRKSNLLLNAINSQYFANIHNTVYYYVYHTVVCVNYL